MWGPAFIDIGVAEVDEKIEPKRYRPVHCTGRYKILAGVEGVEPANAGIKIRCLNQLGDTPTRDRSLMLNSHSAAGNQPINHCHQPEKLPIFQGMGLQISAFANLPAIWMNRNINIDTHTDIYIMRQMCKYRTS